MEAGQLSRYDGKRARGLQPEVVIPNPVRNPAEQAELIKDVGHAVSREELRRRHDLKVQVRCRGITARPDQPEQLAPGHLLADVYPDRTWIHVGVQHVQAGADPDGDMVADGLING